MTNPPTPVTYARRLGLFSGTMTVIGGIIGSGIFMNSAIVAQRVGSGELTLAAWILGGAIAMVGALCFAELGARMPRAGGGYSYLRSAFGPIPGFLYGWALLLVMATGAMAAVAVTFASYATALLGLSPSFTNPIAIGAIVLLSFINIVGVEPGAVTQNLFTVLKLAALAALIGAGLFLHPGTIEQVQAAAVPVAAPTGWALVVGMGTALVPVLFACGGWQQTNFIAEEIIEPEKNLPRALILGVLTVVAVYVLANVTYLKAMGPAGLAASKAPAADAMRILVGPGGATLISAGIALSTFGFLGLVILVTPRVYQAMAADGLFFSSFARLHPKFRTPVTAIVFQSVWAVILLETGSYGELLDYVVFCDWIFFGLAVATLFVFRRRDPADKASGFRVPGYPVIPILFILAAIYVVLGSVASNLHNAIRGVILLALGVPVCLFWQRRNRMQAPGFGR
ncbi:MAG TPA: amino acid permease [Gemmatimonadales bacterium]|nr:amino acid permease [Gemmatimonadales bacterium]